MKSITNYANRFFITGLMFILLSGATLKAQTVASGYTFAANSGTYTAIAGTTIHAATVDDACVASIPIGFTFNYSCNNFTTVSVSSNGWLSFNSTTSSSAYNELASNTIGNVVAPLWDDLQVFTGGAVTYTTTGASPNRIFTVQWSKMEWYYSASGDVISFQAKLYETTNKIEFIYKQGATAVSSGSASIGLSGPNSGDYLSLNGVGASPTASSSTETTTLSTKPANNQVYSWTPATACSGMPSAGTATASPATVCSGTPTSLTLTGASTGCGISYQWQSATVLAGPYTNISGATANPYTVNPTAVTYYRCVTTCSNGGATNTSSVASVALNAPTTCYCISAATSTSDMDITKVAFGTINNTSATVSLTGTQGTAIGTAGMYSDWRGSTVPIPSVMQGSTTSFSVIVGGTAYSHRVDVYIDFNHDGDLVDAGESFTVFAYANPTLPNTTTVNITVPLSALTGNTLMRVVCVESATSTPCGTYTWGETEDYIINITAAPPCSGLPVGGSLTASTSGTCGNVGAISVTGSTTASGLTYQWYSGPTSTGAWTLISGATGETYTPSVYGLYYRRVVTCTSSGLSANSSSMQYNSSAPINDECANATLLTVNPTTTCTTVTPGTVACASASSQSNSCYGTSDDDVWFKFVATSTFHSVSLLNIAGSTTDMYFAVYKGSCGSLVNIICSDADSQLINGFIVGQTYYIRVYTYTSGAQTSTFNLCIGTPPPPPAGSLCNGASPFCTGTTYNFPAGVGSGTGEVGPNYGCLSSTPNPSWYFLRVGTTGPIEMHIQGSNLDDVDFACWGPFTDTDAACTGQLTGSSTTSHHASGASIDYPSLNMVDCSFNSSYEEWCYIPNAVVGEYYLLLLTNFSNTAQNIIFSQTTGTGGTDCSIVAPPVTNNGPLCVGQTLQLTVTTPVTGATYAWTGPNGFNSTAMNPSIASITLAGAGVYSLVITVGASVSAPVTTTVVVSANPTATITNNSGGATQLTCALTTISATAGTGSAYAWSGGATPATAANSFTTPGTYTVTVTNGGICTSTASIVISQNITPPTVGITNNTGTTILTCATTAISVTATGGGTYAWSGGATPATANNSLTAAGTYTVTVTAANGCTATSSITLTQNITPPVVAITNNTGTTILTCATTAISVTATPAGATSYAWSGGATPGTANNSLTAAGTYTVTVTAANGCTATSSITLTQNITPPVVAITNNTGTTILTCATTAISVTATGGGTYAWSGGATPATANNSLTTAGTYTVTVTAANGCTATSSITLTQNITPPVVAITNNTGTTILTCATTAISVTATPAGATSYAWSGGSTPATANNSLTAAGTYTVTVTAANGCTATSSITLTQNITPPVVAITNNTGTTILTCATTAISVTATPAGATSYAWSGGSTPATANNSLTAAGTYTVTVTAANGCTATSSITLTQNITLPLAAITNNSGGVTQLTCALTSISVTATPAGAASYSWSGGSTPGTANNSITAAGTYTVTVTGANGCTATSSITLTQNITPPLAAITNNSGGATQLTCALTSISVTATPAGAASYSWSGGSTPGTANNSITAAGTYTVTVTGANGCTDTESITISQDALVITASITNNSGGATQLTCALTAINVTAIPAGGSTYVWSSGATPATDVNSFATPGTYTVTVTMANGCTGTSSITLTQDITPPTTGITNNTGTAILTCTTTSISVTATPAGATSYAWSGGATPGTANNSFTTSGTYTVTVTAANGCTATSSITLSQDITPPTTAITNNTGTVAFTCTTTSISVTATPAGAASYSWSNGSSSANTSFTTPGTYTVTVTAANGCNATSSITLSQDITPPTIGITNNTGTTALTCTTTSISVTATPAGAASYAWSNGATTANNSFTTPGTYTVTVTAANGCTATSSITLSQSVAPPNVSITNITGTTSLTCTTTSISVTTTPAGAASYAWSGGATPTTANNSFTTPGTYSVTVTMANGCTGTSNITLSQNITPPSPTITNNTGSSILTCTNTTISVTATPAGATSYAWSGGATPGTANNSFTTPGTYIVTVTTANGCTATTNIVLTQNTTPPTVAITNNTGSNIITCTTTSISVTATPAGATSYAWSGGATPSTANNSFTTPGAYIVTVTAANGCTATSNITVTQNIASPPVSISNNTGTTVLTCLTTAISATAGTGNSYAWSGGSTPATAINGFTTPGTYSVTVTAANGCTASTSIVISQSITAPTVSITNNTGATILTCTTPTINVTATGGGTYNWGGGVTTAANSFTAAGSYTVTVTTTNGCTATSNITITQNITAPSINITNNTGTNELTCATTSINVAATGGGTYVWNGGATPTTAGNSFSTPNTYTVTVTGTNGCTATSNIVITQNTTPPSANITNNTGFTLLNCVNANISVTATGGNAYHWSGGATPTTDANTFATPGTYSVTVTGANGCTAATSITITQVAPVVISLVGNVPDHCNQGIGQASVTAIGGSGIYTYDWGTTPLQIAANATHLLAGNYQVIANDGQCADTLLITIENIPGPIALFEAVPGIVTSNNPLVRFQNTSIGATSYSWAFGDGETSIEEGPSHLYTESGDLYATLYVVDDFGCVDSVSHPIKIIDDLNIFIPNTFSPNGDGKNDVFRPYGKGYSLSGYEMNIYDRWGQIVFNSSVFEKGWDGRIKNRKLDITGVFTYRIVIYDLKGKDHIYTGHLSILGSLQIGDE